MNFGISFRNMRGDGDLIQYIDHRLAFTFARTEHEIEDAKITLTDINGPKGGVDKECQIVLTSNGQRQIVVSERRANIRQAIDRCLYRASQSLNRKIKRRQARLRRKLPVLRPAS